MAFPEDPLGLKVEIRAGVWTDITADCKTADPIQHARGIRNAGTVADPASVPLKLDNTGGKYSPRNPMSPYYGLIGRNTPVRLWLPGGTHFLDLDGQPTTYASTPDTPALDITGDLDIRWEGEASWYGPGARILIGKWGATGDHSYHLRLQDGRLYLHTTRDGTIGPMLGQPLPRAMPSRAAVRGTLDADDGTGGSVLSVYWATTIAGPWTLIGEPVRFDELSPIYSSTAPLSIAPHDGDVSPARSAIEGRVYAAEVRSGIDGTLVAAPDFEAQALGSAPFTDAAGRTWSYSGQAAIADRQERFVGEIAEWPQKWVPSGALVWTPVQAAGILRRLGQGQKALDSTLRRRIPSGLPDAYWPFEEEREASRAYSPIPGVEPAAVTGVEWAALNTLPSSQALPRLTAAATLSAIVPAGHEGQWQVEFVYNADDKAPAADTEIVSVSTTGTVRRWSLNLRTGAGWIYGYDASGTAIVNQGVILGSDIFHGWVRMQFWVRDDGGGQMTWRLNLQDVGGDAGGIGRSTTAVPGRVTAVTANWGPATEGWGFGHLSVLPTAQSSLYTGSDNAYAGETTWSRIRRLAGEEGIPAARISGELQAERVGPQSPDTLVSLLQEAADVDGGMLLEDAHRPGLIYRDRSSLYTQEPALTLTYGAPGLAPPLEPVDDDTATRNDVTISREGGSSARAVLEEGSLSVQSPPDGIGVYDESKTLSLADDTQPEPIAYWQLHLGTFDGARYPSVRVLLHRAPDLIPQVLALREGDLIRLQGLPPWVAYGDVDLIVTGWTETLLPRTWEIVFTCDPAGPWNTAQASHPVYARADTEGSALSVPVTATDTVLPVRATDGLLWTTDPADMPIPIQAGGEVMTATAVGAQLADTFARTSTNGWGSADTGQPWTWHGFGAATDYDVNGVQGRHSLTSRNVYRITTLDSLAVTDVETVTTVTMPVAPTGNGVAAYSLLRTNADSTTFYMARLYFNTSGTAALSIRKRTPDETVLATYGTELAHTAGNSYTVRFRAEGSTLSARFWPAGTPEPETWHITATDTDLPGPGGIGVRSFALSTNTNTLPIVVSFDDYQVTDAQMFTVIRSVNGVTKPHPAGTPVSLAYPAIASL